MTPPSNLKAFTTELTTSRASAPTTGPVWLRTGSTSGLSGLHRNSLCFPGCHTAAIFQGWLKGGKELLTKKSIRVFSGNAKMPIENW